MRKKYFLLVLLVMGWLSSTVMAEDYLMPQYGYETQTVSKDAPLTFYDNAGTGSFASSTFNSQSTVVFKPATEGYAIQVTFEELELHNYQNSANATWKCYLKVYNGTFDQASMTYPTSGSSVNEFPDNDSVIGYYKGEDIINPMPVLSSAAADGSMSFCFYAKDPSPNASPGWKATVTEVQLEAMTVESAAANYDFVDGEVWSGKQSVAMAGFGITTEGYSSPDKLQTLTFTVEQAGVIDPTALKLYAGQAASAAGMTALAGTITESAGVYTYTLDEPYALSNGNNKFMLAGDILSTAAFNATAKVNITGIATVGGFTTFTAETPAEMKVAAMYLMTTDATYSISEETKFYDDGGKDGKRSNSFTGKVTFKPATEGKKVQIDFKTISLFYNSSAVSVGNQDVLKIYNGTAVDESKLLYTVETATMSNLVLKSTADNGALTVYLATKTPSESMMGNGWEAVVSEFTPVKMSVVGSEVKKTASTVSAATADVEYIGFNIKTENTEPALQAKSFTLNTNNTYQLLKAAKVYYTGVYNTFAKTKQVAAANIEANEVTITAEEPLTLREGDNWFWVAIDIADRAQTNTTAELQLQKVVFADGTEYNTFSNPTEVISIKNVAYSTEGTKNVDIFDKWEFTHTPSSEYSENYATGTTDQITIFRPTTAGRVIQMDFKDFEVYYSYYKAKFEIYDGEGTTGTKLFEVTSSDLAKTNPGSFRSTTGALTVVFNPNASYSSYNAKGWHADVYEYELKDMSLETITVEQASTKLVTLGEEKAALLDLTVSTEGTLNPLTLDAVTVSLKGTESNISKVYLLQEGTVLAEADAAATVTLTLATPAELSEYDNAFQIAVDVREDATIDASIDAAISGLTVSGNAQAVTAGDPEGARPIKNVYCLQSGDNGTKNIGQNSLMFYDDGCADGTYTKNIEGYITFKPTTAGCAVELVVNSYKLSSGAPVKIYYGTSHDGDADATVEYNYSEPIKYVGQSFISSAEDGSLTVYFKDQSYGSANEGWEFEIREHKLIDLSIESVTATSIASGMQTVGAKDLKMLQVAVTVIGDRTPITINAINVAANEHTDGTKLYQTGKVATFSDSELFTAPYAISERGTYYFWVTADASTEANDNDVVSVSLTSIRSGENTIIPTTAEIAQTKLAHGMKGEYYISAEALADFHSVADAIEAMNILGIEGNVVFNIAAGNYTEQVTLPEVKGTSNAATITFCSATGNAADVVFASDETSDTEGVWTINGMDWLTLKNITFKSGKEGYASVLVLKNKSQHVTVDGCYLTSDAPESNTSQTMQLVRLISEDEDNANCSYFTLQNSVLTNGYNGINLSQGAYATHPNQAGVSIIGNTFVGQQKSLILGTMQKDVTILNNSFTTTTSTTDCRAIDLRTKLEGHILIAGNTIVINATGSGYAHGIYFDVNSQANCAEGTVVDIYNNAISLTSAGSSLSSGIRLRWLREVNITYNTVLINSPFSTAAPLWLSNNPTNLVLTAKNNILQNAGTGSVLNGEKGTYSHNALYSADGKISNLHDSFADWQTAVSATEEDGNLSEQAVFASNSLLLLKEAGNLVSATPVATITTDITGKERHATTPTIGAYEYDADLFRVPVMAEDYPIAHVKDSLVDIVVKADNIGTARVLVLTADADVPTVEAVVAQGAELTLQKDVEATLTVKDLNEVTAYKAYVVTLSPIGDAAETASAVAFTTAWTLRPVVLNPIGQQTVAADASVTLTATLATEYEQAQPYTYAWRTAYSDAIIGNDATLTVSADKATEYICTVTDQFDQKGYVSAHVHVAKAAAEATFEEYVLAENGHKHVDEAWVDNTETYLYSGSYAFANTPNKAYNAYNGYAICSDKSTEATGYYTIDQFRSAAGGAYEGNNYAVAYYSAPSDWFAGYTDPITLTNSAEPQTISGFYITNTVYTLDAVLNGDYANDAFGEGDVLSLTIKGYNGETKAGEKVFYLADYRDGKRNALDKWEWLDLSSLGAVTRLEFEMYTTKSDEFGFTTPLYFCLDNFGGTKPSDATGMDEVQGDNVQCTKVLIDGKLFILRGERIYDLNGRLIR